MDKNYVNIGHPAIKLMEECSEVIKAVSKGMRFGWDNYHPDRPKSNNFTESKEEYIDLKIAFDNLVKHIRTNSTQEG